MIEIVTKDNKKIILDDAEAIQSKLIHRLRYEDVDTTLGETKQEQLTIEYIDFDMFSKIKELTKIIIEERLNEEAIETMNMDSLFYDRISKILNTNIGDKKKLFTLLDAANFLEHKLLIKLFEKNLDLYLDQYTMEENIEMFSLNDEDFTNEEKKQIELFNCFVVYDNLDETDESDIDD